MEMLWQKDALFAGMTADAFKLSTVLSYGWFWMRRAGCCSLYRSSSVDQIDFANVIIVDEQNAQTISPPYYLSHDNDSTYFYLLRKFNASGWQECTLSAAAKVKINTDGELAAPQPNKIFAWSARQIDSGKVQLVWFYCPVEQESLPMYFKIYGDNGTGQIDYVNPLTTIAYKGRRFYHYNSDISGQAAILFAVRAEDAAGVQDSSLTIISIQLYDAIPNAANIISIQHI